MKRISLFAISIFLLFGSHSLMAQSANSKASNEIVERLLPDGNSPFTNLTEPPELVLENGVHLDYVQAVKYTPDGKEIVTASWDKTIRIWDAANGKLIRTIRTPAYAGIEGQIFTMDISPDKKYIVAAGSSVGEKFNARTDKFIGHYVLLIDFKTGKLLDVAPNHDNSIFSVAFSPDSKKVASCAGLGDNKVNIYDIEPAQHKLTLSESFQMTGIADSYFPQCDYMMDDMCDHKVLGVRFSPDSKECYAVDEHGMLIKFTLKTANTPSHYQLIGESAGRKNAVITGKITEKAALRSIATDPKGRYIAIGDWHGKVLIVDAKGKTMEETEKGGSSEILLATIPLLKKSFITAMAFDPTGTLLAVTIDNEVRVYEINLSDATTPVSITKPIITFKEHDSGVLSVAFSPDGKNIVSSGGNYNITYVWEARTGKILLQLGEGKYCTKITRVGAHKSDPFIIGFGTQLTTNQRVNHFGTISKAFDLKNLKVIETATENDFTTSEAEVEESGATYPEVAEGLGVYLRSFITLKTGHTIIGTNGELFVDNMGDLLVMTGTTIYGMAQTADGKTFYAGESNGTIRIYDAESLKHIATLYVAADNEWILFTPDGYYTASKYGAKLVGWQINNGLRNSPKFYPFEQFDLRLNRPDIVLSRIGGISKKRIDMLYLAYQKRLEKMGIAEASLTGNLNAPNIEVDLAITETTQKQIQFKVKAADTENDLERLNIYINDVPFYGSQGFSLKSKPSKTIDKNISLELCNGSNKIQVSVLNMAGIESFQETHYVNYRGALVKPNLYILAIGVSDYTDNNFDLAFAAKDANDITAFYGNQTGTFATVKTLKIVDAQATKENIMQAQNFLKDTKIDDEVILFVAGHGLLDDKLDFYFATTDIDFYNPAGRGLKYDELESLIDKIPARKKLLLIDACHSGELDKETVQVGNELTASNTTGVSSRGFKVIKNNDDLDLMNVFELMRSMFSDLRKGAGAMVISSASGKEFAFESAEWQNGVFTYSFLEGLKSGNADTSKDQSISVSEVRDYVGKRVNELTNGRQTPTSRTENLENDFRVW